MKAFRVRNPPPSKALLEAAASEMYDALALAAIFIAEEADRRKESGLPNNHEYIRSAENALDTIRSAMAKAHGTI